MGKGLETSLFNRLPLEIRREIYGYVLGREENCMILLPFKIRAQPERCCSMNDYVTWAARNEGLIAGSWKRFWPRRPALLQTCRQIYTEAVDLLYTDNTFVVKHPELLSRFIKAIPPQRLNTIRSLRICLETWQCGVLSQWAHTQTGREEWGKMWRAVAGMEHLMNLEVEFVGESYSYTWAEQPNIYLALLPSLLQIRGLHRFQLRVRIRQTTREALLDCEDVPLTRETKALVKEIEESVKLPRTKANVPADSEHDWSEELRRLALDTL
ncbi:MAG: hypothetical protein Q9170_003089, partial [Blastenia crenularia]